MGSASGVWQGMVAEKAGVEMMVRVGSSIIDEVPSVRSWFRCHVVNALGVPPKIRKMAQKILDGEQAPTPKKGPPSGSVGEEGGVALLPIVTAAKPSSGACELKKEMEELRKSYEELYEEYVKVCGLLEKSNRAQLEHAAERARTEKELLRWRRSGNVMMASRNSAVVGVVERMMMVLEEGSLVEIAQCYAKVSVARSGGEKGPTREELKMIFLAMFRKACEIRATELLGYALGVAVGGDFLETVTVSEVQEILRCALRGMEFAPREEGLRSLLVQVCSEVPQEVLKEGWRRLEATLKFGGKGEVEERVRELLSRLSGA
ncbi:hypothetical protein Pmar_PMAR025652 [Perkinsus marinus ATCC 50983]|uniref:Uncharacterized protein n=1 Tax=Perkinsus marinus (strain ATCC 50983 / TXsc) TaxID=423536 RepID=C5KIM4_PERM5|nr:hypothetical protein Pmar_PMAR025652 [Perkinsus marinus ATCC 50983]EER15639.1 hypothetical protein Pmar_PMAR025652 [Perkinsus marinus ATCC 50983]|eukprot:XP_002783843.1 hypothetical protein Pmar_PMAR025652 [Perkinsus marinus ATCC 50983]